MAIRRSLIALIAALALSTAIATILALLPAESVRWSTFAVAVAVPALLVVVLVLAVIRMTTHGIAGSPTPPR